jgi:acyl-CoA thioester hydrolase
LHVRAHIDISLRWGDQDAYGHVNNVAYARFLEEARIRMFWLGAAREATGLERHFNGSTPDGPKMLVANLRIDFTAVMDYSERTITVETWIGKLGGSSLEVHHEIVHQEILDATSPDGGVTAGGIESHEVGGERIVYARAITSLVMVDGVTMRPVRLGPEARAAIVDWTDEPLVLGRR